MLRKRFKNGDVCEIAPVESTQTKVQLAFVLAWLKQVPLNTFELRQLGICHLGDRIFVLRARGHLIDTIREGAVDEAGLEHKKVARYHYRGFKEVQS